MIGFHFQEEAAIGISLEAQEAVYDASIDSAQHISKLVDPVTAVRGEQPDSAALPTSAGALRGEPPLSITERSEV